MLLSANTSPLNPYRGRQAGTAITVDDMTMIDAVAIYGFFGMSFFKTNAVFVLYVYFATVTDVVSTVQRSFLLL